MKIPVHNTNKMTMFVAGVMIPPGETKHFEEHHVPPSLRQQPEELLPEVLDENPVIALLGGTIKEITEALPALSDEDYETLQTAEAAGEKRKGLMAAFAAEDLRRANAGADS